MLDYCEPKELREILSQAKKNFDPLLEETAKKAWQDWSFQIDPSDEIVDGKRILTLKGRVEWFYDEEDSEDELWNWSFKEIWKGKTKAVDARCVRKELHRAGLLGAWNWESEEVWDRLLRIQ